MKVVILAGGLGTRISEESHLRPKPMIEIGTQPILWHIMKLYSAYGFNDFVICCGYKGSVIKQYFAEYYLHNSDVTFDFTNNGEPLIHDTSAEPWKVTVVDTGLNTMTGGRIKRIAHHIGDEPFLLTYGDGVSNVDINELVAFHRSHGKSATLTSVAVSQRFGLLDINDNGAITSFREKSVDDASMINGGFMVLEPSVFNLLENDTTVFEAETLTKLAQDNQLMAYEHRGFWQCMDTQRDKNNLDELWESGSAPWKVWK